MDVKWVLIKKIEDKYLKNNKIVSDNQYKVYKKNVHFILWYINLKRP